MTNNNWEEKFENLIKDCYSEEVFGKVDESLIPKDGVMAASMREMAKSIGYIVAPVIRDLLTKKDQEHKAELEEIQGDIEHQLGLARYGNDDELNPCYERAFENLIAIPDKHINK